MSKEEYTETENSITALSNDKEGKEFFTIRLELT